MDADLNDDRGVGCMNVSYGTPLDDDHVALGDTLYNGLEVILRCTIIYVHAFVWGCGGFKHVM